MRPAGYRGQSSSALFRIVEVDSDDDQSVGSRPLSPRPQAVPGNLISIVPTPVNGSRDSLGDSLRPEESEHPETRLRVNLRRARRGGRSIQRSDSSESPTPKGAAERVTSPAMERLSATGYNR